jgi:hypothetical protein
MGWEDSFAKRDEIAKERRRLQREKNGYVPRGYRQEDLIRGKDKRLVKTNHLHQKYVNLWMK